MSPEMRELLDLGRSIQRLEGAKALVNDLRDPNERIVMDAYRGALQDAIMAHFVSCWARQLPFLRLLDQNLQRMTNHLVGGTSDVRFGTGSRDAGATEFASIGR